MVKYFPLWFSKNFSFPLCQSTEPMSLSLTTRFKSATSIGEKERGGIQPMQNIWPKSSILILVISYLDEYDFFVIQ